MEPKIFDLKFLHIVGRVTVGQQPYGYLAFITFPGCYMACGFNNLTISDITADDIDHACELAGTFFKSFYWPLDNPVKCVFTGGFFIRRALYRTVIRIRVGDINPSFVVTRQVYTICENVFGQKYDKVKYFFKDGISTRNAVFIMNYELVFNPLYHLGFNGKFIERLLARYNKIGVNRLRMFDDGGFIDDLQVHPEKLVDHVADLREDFEIQLGLVKLRKLTQV